MPSSQKPSQGFIIEMSRIALNLLSIKVLSSTLAFSSRDLDPTPLHETELQAQVALQHVDESVVMGSCEA